MGIVEEREKLMSNKGKISGGKSNSITYGGKPDTNRTSNSRTDNRRTNNSRTNNSINNNRINSSRTNSSNTSNSKKNNNRDNSGEANSNNTIGDRNSKITADKRLYSSGRNITNKKAALQEKVFNRHTIPLIFIIAVVPLIVKMYKYNSNVSRYMWGSLSETRMDFFLYYKQWALVAAAAVMAIMLSYRVYKYRYKIKISPILYPLGLYALLAVISTIFSDNISFSLLGSMDQFESVFALLSYCITIFYTFLYIKSEYDIETVIRGLLISTLIMSALGISQYLGDDFFSTETGTRLITGGEYGKGGLNFVMGEGRVYMSLFNPNYVGVYVSMVVPLFLVLLLYSKKLLNSLLYLAAIIGMLICLFGSQSLAGFVGIAVAVFGIVAFMWRYLMKRFYITIPVFLVLFAALFVLNRQTDGYMVNRIKAALDVQRVEEPALSGIVTGDDKVSITYKGNKLNMSLKMDGGGKGLYYVLTDGDNNEVLYDFDSASGAYIIRDERFPFSFMQMAQDDYISFYLNIDGRRWVFSNQLGDGTYYYYNGVYRWDKIVSPPAVYKGYERFATGRGYLWSRTLPLIKQHILLGSGPDTFLTAFPQQDYVGFYNYGYTNMIITKPHSLYMQIAVNTGLISLIAFLAFYAMYFFASLRLYIRGRFSSYYAKVGVAILIGTTAYMVTGLTNDSSITTAPVFWCLMGLGIVANAKAKPLILEEIAAARAKKQEKKAPDLQ